MTTNALPKKSFKNIKRIFTRLGKVVSQTYMLKSILNDNTKVMINQILVGLVDFIYGTGRVKLKFELDNPNENVLAADTSNSIRTISNQGIQRGLDWVTSQRAVVLLTDKKKLSMVNELFHLKPFRQLNY